MGGGGGGDLDHRLKLRIIWHHLSQSWKGVGDDMFTFYLVKNVIGAKKVENHWFYTGN